MCAKEKAGAGAPDEVVYALEVLNDYVTKQKAQVAGEEMVSVPRNSYAAWFVLCTDPETKLDHIIGELDHGNCATCLASIMAKKYGQSPQDRYQCDQAGCRQAVIQAMIESLLEQDKLYTWDAELRPNVKENILSKLKSEKGRNNGNY